MVESLPEGLSLSKDREPTQSRLGTFQDQHFEQTAVVVNRDTPFLIMVLHVKGIAGSPSTPYFIVFHRFRSSSLLLFYLQDTDPACNISPDSFATIPIRGIRRKPSES
jgi:hypothetical protein